MDICFSEQSLHAQIKLFQMESSEIVTAVIMFLCPAICDK